MECPMPVKTGPKQGRFPPGRSGNPKGRPKSSRFGINASLAWMADGDCGALVYVPAYAENLERLERWMART